jgi:hypothetical protein
VFWLVVGVIGFAIWDGSDSMSQMLRAWLVLGIVVVLVLILDQLHQIRAVIVKSAQDIQQDIEREASAIREAITKSTRDAELENIRLRTQRADINR